jgi:hypothetical protein
MKSTDDGSKEYLEKYPDFITIKEIDDPDGFNDTRNQNLKNNEWKISKGVADFVIVTDFDEFIYSPDFKKELEYMKENNMTIVAPEIYELVSDKEVIYDKLLNDGDFLHEQINNGFYNKLFGKHCIFNPNEIREINYNAGAHKCRPKGNVKYYDKKNIYLFHAKYLGLKRFLNQTSINCNRLSEDNIKNGHGYQYKLSDDKKTKDYNNKLKKSINISDIIVKNLNYTGNESKSKQINKSQLDILPEIKKEENNKPEFKRNIIFNYIISKIK